MRIASYVVAVGLVMAACAGASATVPAPEPHARALTIALTQGRPWPTTTPGAAGFDAARLDELADDAKAAESTCLAVVRDGRLVEQWNWGVPRGTPREVFSVTKSVTSALVGIAVRDGDLRLDDPVADYVRSWRDTPSAAVTVRDLLSNDSGRFWSLSSDYNLLLTATDRTAYAVGLDQQYPPGSAWAYNNAAIQVLDRVISRAVGMPTDQYAAERLFTPLDMERTRMTRDGSGRSTNVFAGLQTTCLDLARFARLYLRDGLGPHGRILSSSYVRGSVGRSSTSLNAAYGHLWWLNRYGVLRGATDAVDDAGQPVEQHVGQLVPDAAPDLYSAIGFGGQIAMVDPGSHTIVVRIGPGGDHGYGLTDAARVVTWALTQP